MLKYIPLVKHTSCTIILDIPELDLSVVMLPIKIPSDINKIDIINEISIIRTIPLLNFKPNNKATITVNISWSIISGINDRIKLTLKNSDLFDYCFKSKNEELSSGVFSIWVNI